MARLNLHVAIDASDKASPVLTKLTKAVGGLASAGKSALGGLQTMGTAALGAVAVGAALAGTAVIGIGTAALGVASEFDAVNRNMQDQLNITADEANALGEVAENVWRRHGDSVEEVGAAIITVQQQMGAFADMSGAQLERTTASAFKLRDAFGVEIAESTNAAAALMKNFGLTADESMDFITAGMQRGLNTSGDFLEAITEYSTQFGSAGASAGQFFSLMESGLGSGMLGVDKAADAFKEFNVRILDGSDSTRLGLAALGLSVDSITASITNGSLTQADVFQMVVDRLGDQTDAALQYQTGVALLGTQFEDLGVDAALALDLTGTRMEDLIGATDTLSARYSSWPALFERVKREGLLAIKPIGEVLLELANDVMPIVEDGLGWIADEFAPRVETAAAMVGEFLNIVRTRMDEGATASDGLKAAVTEMLPPETANKLIGIIDKVSDFASQASDFAQNHGPALQSAVVSIGAAFAGAGIAVAIAGIGSAILALASPIGLIVAASAALGVAWANDWFGMRAYVDRWIDAINDAKLAVDAMSGANDRAVESIIADNIANAESMSDLIAEYEKINDIQHKWGGFATFITGTSGAMEQGLADLRLAIAENSGTFEEYMDVMREIDPVRAYGHAQEENQRAIYNTIKAQQEAAAAQDVEIMRFERIRDERQALADAALAQADAEAILARSQHDMGQGIIAISDDMYIWEQQLVNVTQSEIDLTIATDEAAAALAEQQAVFAEYFVVATQATDAIGFFTIATNEAGEKILSTSVEQSSFNQAIYDSAVAAGASAEQLAILGVGLGTLSEAEAEAALKSAILMASVDELAAAYVRGDTTISEMRTQLGNMVRDIDAMDISIDGGTGAIDIYAESMSTAGEAALIAAGKIDELGNVATAVAGNYSINFDITTSGAMPSVPANTGGGMVGDSVPIAFNSGGFTGWGSPNEIAGLVHKREYVIPARVVDALGVDAIEQLLTSVSGQTTSNIGNMAGQSSADGDGGYIEINIDARGAEHGMERKIKDAVARALQEAGADADARIRTGLSRRRI